MVGEKGWVDNDAVLHQSSSMHSPTAIVFALEHTA